MPDEAPPSNAVRLLALLPEGSLAARAVATYLAASETERASRVQELIREHVVEVADAIKQAETQLD